MERGRNLVGWTVALAAAIALAVVVGQQLSAQSMAVVMGLIVGVAVSVPVSLAVVWITARVTLPNAPLAPLEIPAPPAPREPRVMFLPQSPAPAPAYAAPNANAGSYPPAGFNSSAYAPPAGPVGLSPRRFTVVGRGQPAEPAWEDENEEAAWTA